MFYAEWQKITGNRWVTAFLIWIFPISALFIMAGALLFALLSNDFVRAQQQLGILPWHETMVNAWQFVNNELGRWIIVAFTAFVFAGEYTNGTWKNLTTRRTRLRLIANKFITTGVFVVSALVLMTVILTIGTGLVAGVIEVDYGLSDAGRVLGDFLGEYLTQTFLVLSITLIAASYAALAAMVTKNVFASVIVGVLVTVGESGVLVLIALARGLLNIDLMWFYQLTPSFNLANISNWINNNAPFVPFNPDEMATYSLETSLLLVVLWAAVFISLTFFLFYRQDIST